MILLSPVTSQLASWDSEWEFHLSRAKMNFSGNRMSHLAQSSLTVIRTQKAGNPRKLAFQAGKDSKGQEDLRRTCIPLRPYIFVVQSILK